jgi:hypothetical protein
MDGSQSEREPDPRTAGATGTRRTGIFERVRALGVMLGGSVTLAGAAVASLVSVLLALAGRRRPAALPALGLAATVLYGRAVRPWHLRWGAEPGDEQLELPGDDLLPARGTEILHAVTIEAPAEDVWPWVAQLGQDRGGFYSYEWLENLAGCQMSNAERIHPEWQHREPGELLYLHPAGGLKVTLFQPGRALGIENWGNVVLVPEDADRTRLIVRGRIPHGVVAAAYALLMEIPHFIMERRMLLGIKARAERTSQRTRGR